MDKYPVTIFPYFITRISGDEIEKFKSFIEETKATNIVNTYQSLIQREIQLKEELTSSLKTFMINLDNRNEQHLIQNLRRDIHNNRKLKKVNEVIRRLDPNTRDTLMIYLELKKEINLKLIYLNEQFISVEAKESKLLRKLMDNDIILKGISLSSRNLSYKLKSALSNQSFMVDDHLKNSIIKYISRIYFKTSPFSTFTNILLGKCKNLTSEQFFICNGQSPIQYKLSFNNYLLPYLLNVLQYHEPILDNLPIRLNPTIKQVDNKFKYLANINNIERFQSIDIKSPVNFIFQNLSKSGRVKIKELISLLMRKYQHNINEIRNYILKLYESRFLILDLKIETLDHNWDLQLIQLLKSFQCKDKVSLQIIKELNLAIKLKNEFHNHNFEKRLNVLSEIEDKIGRIKQSIHLDKSNGHKFNSNNNFIYEDTVINGTFKLNKVHITRFIKKLNFILLKISFLNNKAEKSKYLNHIFQKYFPENREVDFIEFSRKYFEHEQTRNNSSDSVQDLSDNHLLWFENLKSYVNRHSNEQSIDFYDFLQNSTVQRNGGHKHQYYGALLQFYETHLVEEGKLSLKCIINGCFCGHGKFMGRFLSLFDKDIIKELREFNSTNQTNICYAENKDGSYFNANIHPPLLNYEIAFPGANNSNDINQINLSDLSVQFNNDHLELIQKSTKKIIYVKDLGLQLGSQRSPIFRLLDNFSGTHHPALSRFIDLIHQIYMPNIHEGRIESDKIIEIPRLVFDNDILIDRKTWIIPKSLLLYKAKDETDFTYFVKLNEWVNKHSILKEVFINFKSKHQINPKNVTDRINCKPQYVNFDNIIFSKLFSKQIKNVNNFIIMKEALPSYDNMLQINGSKFSTEFSVEWKTII